MGYQLYLNPEDLHLKDTVDIVYDNLVHCNIHNKHRNTPGGTIFSYLLHEKESADAKMPRHTIIMGMTGDGTESVVWINGPTT